MAKKRKAIKRFYEKGKEITFGAQRKETVLPTALLKQFGISSAVYRQVGKRKQRILKRKRIGKRLKPAAAAPRPRVYLSEQYKLPPHYEKTRLTLLAKDPSHIFAYWETAGDFLEKVRMVFDSAQAASASPVLRIYDITLVDFNGNNANNYFDIDVGGADNWYINLGGDNISCVGDFGFRAPSGDFVGVARSNTVQTPRSTFSPRTEHIWMSVTDEGAKRPHVAAYAFLPHPPLSYKKTQPPLPAKKRTIYLNEDDIRKFYGGISPLLQQVVAERLKRYFDKGYGPSGKYEVALEGEHYRPPQIMFPCTFIKKIMVGASEELLFLGASEALVPGSLGASDILREKVKQRSFFFELATELIVYGRTEPDARLYLGDENIPLRHDGTFSLHFALPDGKIPLEFKAVSHDDVDSKKINTYVTRTTQKE